MLLYLCFARVISGMCRRTNEIYSLFGCFRLSPHVAPRLLSQVVGVWDLYVGKGRVVKDIAAAEVSRVARAKGALGDWKGITGLLGTKSTAGGGSLPDLDRLRCGKVPYRALSRRLSWCNFDLVGGTRVCDPG